jgi:hypothetical protein
MDWAFPGVDELALRFGDRKARHGYCFGIAEPFVFSGRGESSEVGPDVRRSQRRFAH